MTSSSPTAGSFEPLPGYASAFLDSYLDKNPQDLGLVSGPVQPSAPNGNIDPGLQQLRNQALLDFNRTLGPRASTRKVQDLLGNYLDDPVSNRTSLEAVFGRFPDSAKTKAFGLLDKYSTGLTLDQAPAATTPAVKPSQLVKEFSSELNPDTSQNRWYDNPYTPRYVNNPTVENFLQKKGDLLERRGEWIQKKALEGDMTPFVKHSQWLRKQGVLPSDAENLVDISDEWLNRTGLANDELNTSPSLYTHEGFSHAFPEKHFGIVDKSMPNAVTAADEVRAELIDVISYNQFDFDDKFNDIWEPASPVQMQDVDSQIKNSRLRNSQEESDALSEKFINRSKELGFKNKYGTSYDDGMAFPGLKGGTIREAFDNAADARHPASNISDLTNLYNEALLPYARDLQYSDRLTLLPFARNGIEQQNSPSSAVKDELYKNMYSNVYFAQDPFTAGAAGAVDLIKNNVRGATTGLAFSAMSNPDIPKQVQDGKYKDAVSTLARDTAFGAATEAGIRAVTPFVSRVAPAAVSAAAPVLGAVAPVVAGVSLFDQGRSGSLTDVLVNKAANVVPGLRADPQTDIGRRAGNEIKYATNSLLSGRMPYSQQSNKRPSPQVSTQRSTRPTTTARTSPANSLLDSFVQSIRSGSSTPSSSRQTNRRGGR